MVILVADIRLIRQFIGRLDTIKEDVEGKYGPQIELHFSEVEVTQADGDVVLSDFRLISWVKQSTRKKSTHTRMLVDWETFAKDRSIKGLPDAFYGIQMRWEERNYDIGGQTGAAFVPVEVIPESATRPEDIQTGQYPHTDVGNAQRLVKRHGRDMRYCHHWKTWLVWDGRRWKVDDTGAVMRRAKETAQAIYLEASALSAQAAQELDKESRRPIAERANRLLSWARRSENVHRIDAMVKLAQSEPGIPVLLNQLDADQWLLNCETGTIDLRRGQLREHCREDLITKLAPVKFDPDAACPMFDRFLAHIMAEDDDFISFLQLVIGYSLTGDVSEQVLIILYGSGANGKSTFLNTLMGMLGDYAMKASPDLLMKLESHPTEKTDLFGKRFVAAIETEEGRKLAEVFVKEVTGGDPIRARRMRENFWQFSPTHKLFLATNHKPNIKDNGHAMWRRLRLVPFNGGILKKCVNSQAVYPLSEQHGLKAQERRYTAHEEGKHWEQVGVKTGVGPVGGVGSRSGPEVDPGVAGEGGDGVFGKGQVGPQVRLGPRHRLPERIRQSPEAYAEFGNDPAEAAASPRYRGGSSRAGCCRCSSTGPGRLLN